MITRLPSCTVLFAAALLAASSSHAEVKLPSIFNNHMVLQQGMPVPVWGWAEANEKVTVRFGDQSLSTQADAAGKWKSA